jgi:hypothetical protein
MATSYVSKSFSLNAAFSTLATGTARETGIATTSTSGNNVDDFRITVVPTLAAGTPTGSKAVFVWVKISDDNGGTFYNGNATGSDAAITLDSPHQFPLGCIISFPTTTLTRGGSFSLKAACGGSLPFSWGFIIENQVGFAFTACTIKVEEVYNT